MRLFIIFLCSILFTIQYGYWFGNNGYVNALSIQKSIEKLEQQNKEIADKNKSLSTEITDIKTNFEIIEEIARKDLNLQKPNEIFIKFHDLNKQIKLESK